MIVVIGSVVIKTGKLSEALAVSQEHVTRSQQEPDCISHAVHQDTENQQRLVFVERWADLASLHKHFEVPASRAFVQALTALAASAPEMTIYDANELTVPG